MILSCAMGHLNTAYDLNLYTAAVMSPIAR